MYFDDNSSLESHPFTIDLEFNGMSYQFTSDNGVFSKNKVDDGTIQLLNGLSLINDKSSLLDFGAGLGIVGIVANKQLGFKHVEGVEINPRSVELAKKNALDNGSDATFIHSNGFEKVEGTFDVIASNPPIRVGKQTLYQWYDQARNYLNDNGVLVLVIRNQQGAKSTMQYCKTLYSNVVVLCKKKSYVVFKCEK